MCMTLDLTLFSRALCETELINHTAGLSKQLVELLSACLIPAEKTFFHWTWPAGLFLNSKSC